MDEILMKFVQENVLTIYVVLEVLKVIAKETPWATDDKVIEILTGVFKKQKPY